MRKAAIEALLNRFRRRIAKLISPDRPEALKMGRGSYGTPHVRSWGEGCTLRIGNFCSIADNVSIFLGGNHRTDWVTTYPFNKLWESARDITGHPYSNGDVTIEHDVWIGSGAVILSGVTLQTGCVIGCRAVVTKDVPPYAVVGGNPAKLIRMRFDNKTIDRLLATHWWAWDAATIATAMPQILCADIQQFLAFAESLEPS